MTALSPSPTPSPTRSTRLGSRLRRVLNRLADRWATPGAGRVALCSPIVGLCAGLGAVTLLLLLQQAQEHVLADLLHLRLPPTADEAPHPISYPYPWWLTLLLPALGGLAAGLLVFRFAPEAEGHGTDAIIRAFHHGGGQIRTRVPFVKGVASVITIGTGGSAGAEGPIAQIGAGLGSALARALRLTPDERRLLMLAGAAGGVGAIFRAPLGGALFACEMLYRSTALESAALFPCLASAIVAYSVFALFITPEPLFAVPELQFHGLAELPAFALLSIACAAVGWLYVRVFYGVRDVLFHPMPIPRAFKPAVGGLMLGALALALPQLLSGGYGWVQWGAIGLPPALRLGPEDPPFVPGMGPALLLTLALLKPLATGLTISSGGSGGLFGPSIVIGGWVGGAVGQLLSGLVPGLHLDPAAFALVGMGGFFAGVSKTPITAIVMICELCGSYSLLVPLMLACGLTMALSRGWTLYEQQVASPLDSPAHAGDFQYDLLERLKVGQVPVRTEGLVTLAEITPLPQILRQVAQSDQAVFPVLDAQGGLVGCLNLADLRGAFDGSASGPLVLAGDLTVGPTPWVTLEDDLHTALKRMTAANLDALPVVRAEAPTALLGLLGRAPLIATYLEAVAARRTPDPEPAPAPDRAGG